MADGVGPGLVRRETRKRLAADWGLEKTQSRGFAGLAFPAEVASHVVCVGEAAGGRRGPRY